MWLRQANCGLSHTALDNTITCTPHIPHSLLGCCVSHTPFSGDADWQLALCLSRHARACVWVVRPSMDTISTVVSQKGGGYWRGCATSVTQRAGAERRVTDRPWAQPAGAPLPVPSPGQWKNNQRSGLGRMVYADGGRYYGQWLLDKKNGKGRYTYPNGMPMLLAAQCLALPFAAVLPPLLPRKVEKNEVVHQGWLVADAAEGGGGGLHVALLSAAGGAYWPIAIRCPSLGPSPSKRGGAHQPLTTL